MQERASADERLDEAETCAACGRAVPVRELDYLDVGPDPSASVPLCRACLALSWERDWSPTLAEELSALDAIGENDTDG